MRAFRMASNRLGFPADHSEVPGVLFIPPADRTIDVPNVKFKSIGVAPEENGVVHFWRRTPPNKWEGSLPQYLYHLRWKDLSAKEAGRPELANNFAPYAEAFRRFVGESKSLEWTVEGDLVIRLADGTTHDLNALSSGEKQVLLIGAEILRWWRPGSLVMIDEPELHLHDLWLSRLYYGLLERQREVGGQVILASQHDGLFSTVDASRTLLLRGKARQ